MTRVVWVANDRPGRPEFFILVHKKKDKASKTFGTASKGNAAKYTTEFFNVIETNGDAFCMNVEGRVVVGVSTTLAHRLGVSEEGMLKTFVSKYGLYKTSIVDVRRNPTFWNNAYKMFNETFNTPRKVKN